MTKSIHLLYLTAESWPTFRADIAVLFGKYLPKHGITSDLVTEQATDSNNTAWQGGQTQLFPVPNNRIASHLSKTWQSLHAVLRCKASDYDAIQVRDMPIIALFALLIARSKDIPFFYWMSFPQSEGQIFRARARGPKAGLRYIFPLVQGTLGKWVLYKLVMPWSHHIFVQSDRMREDVASYGIPFEKMTPVPMGVDIAAAQADVITASDDERLTNKKVVVYLGTLDRARQIELLFEMLSIALKSDPDILLVLVGDTEDIDHRNWLHAEAERIGVNQSVLWTGWVPMQTAWQYVRAADVGISIFPRGFLLDSATPTKVVEYMALGIPVLANDNPDQQKIITEANCGVCVELTATNMAKGLTALISNTTDTTAMSERGLDYVRKQRDYEMLATHLSKTYVDILNTTKPNIKKSRQDK
jgi:glycosyltransferase involved in cell wall biosynthesis